MLRPRHPGGVAGCLWIGIQGTTPPRLGCSPNSSLIFNFDFSKRILPTHSGYHTEAWCPSESAAADPFFFKQIYSFLLFLVWERVGLVACAEMHAGLTGQPRCACRPAAAQDFQSTRVRCRIRQASRACSCSCSRPPCRRDGPAANSFDTVDRQGVCPRNAQRATPWESVGATFTRPSTAHARQRGSAGHATAAVRIWPAPFGKPSRRLQRWTRSSRDLSHSDRFR